MKTTYLSVRDQNRFISAMDNIANSDRIHKKDLKTLEKILGKLDNIKNTQEPLTSISDKVSAQFNIRSPEQVKAFFANAMMKLGDQGSKLFENKNMNLTDIGGRLSD